MSAADKSSKKSDSSRIPAAPSKLTSEKWQQIDSIFQEVVELDDSSRQKRLTELTGDDSSLRSEVESLIKHDKQGSNLPAIKSSLANPATHHPTSRRAGNAISRYRLLFPLAVNRASEVWCAEDTENENERVAIKFLRVEGDAVDRRLERFRNEALLLAQFRHPNVAEFLDCGKDESGIPYIVTRYVSGTPITAYADQKTLDIDQRLQLASRVCEAVSYAHRFLVVHRDLKPANILVSSKGEPIILDFGISKTLDDPNQESSQVRELTGLITTTERPMTPAYASPEQVHGDPVTTATDQHAIGLILYELLCGHHAFSDEVQPAGGKLFDRISQTLPLKPSEAVAITSSGATFEEDSTPVTPQLICALRKASARQLNKRLRNGLDAIVLRTLAKDPSNRYTSVTELQNDLHNALMRRPVSADPVRKDQVRTWVRNAPLVSVVCSMLIAGAIAAGATTWFNRRQIQATKSQASQAREEIARLSEQTSDLRQALSSHPDFGLDERALNDPSTVKGALARSLAMQGKYDAAHRLLAALRPQTPEASLQSAYAYQLLGRPTHGLLALDSLDNEFKKRRVDSLRLQLLLNAGRNGEAMTLFETEFAEYFCLDARTTLWLIQYQYTIGWKDGATETVERLRNGDLDFELNTKDRDNLEILRQLVRDKATSYEANIAELSDNDTSDPEEVATLAFSLAAQAKYLKDERQFEPAAAKNHQIVDLYANSQPDHCYSLAAMQSLSEIANEMKDEVTSKRLRDHVWSRVREIDELGIVTAAWNGVAVAQRERDKIGAIHETFANYQSMIVGDPYLERRFLMQKFHDSVSKDDMDVAKSTSERLCELEEQLWSSISIESAFAQATRAFVLKQLDDPSAEKIDAKTRFILTRLRDTLPNVPSCRFLLVAEKSTTGSKPRYEWIHHYLMHRFNPEEEQLGMVRFFHDQVVDEFPSDAELLKNP